MATFGVAHTDNPEAGKRGLLEGFLDGIATSQSVRQERVGFADDSRPFSDRSGLPLVGHGGVLLSVVGLNLRRCPAAIFGRVGAVNVHAIKGATVRAWSHITQKRLKAVSPRRAHRDSAFAIQRVFVGVRVVATVLGALPCAVFSGARSAVRQMHRYHSVTTQTAATLGISMSQFPLSRHNGSAALAEAFPIAVMAPRWHSLDNSQTCEHLPSQIASWSTHNWQFTTVKPSARGN